jgi:hypothetical protein
MCQAERRRIHPDPGKGIHHQAHCSLLDAMFVPCYGAKVVVVVVVVVEEEELTERVLS